MLRPLKNNNKSNPKLIDRILYIRIDINEIELGGVGAHL